MDEHVTNVEPKPRAEANLRAREIWLRSLAWLAFLAPFFFWSYGLTNAHGAALGVNKSLFFAWERRIPFWDWTIVPYWSIDLFYGLSFLTCKKRFDIDRHAFRLLSVQLISVASFFLFPLKFAFDRPASDGVFRGLFDLLLGFDQPYNQAPSLHISLLIILAVRFSTVARGPWRWILVAWSLLIGVSVLTTYQHHFVDIPSGLLAGLFCIWLWPDSSAPRPEAERLRMYPRTASAYALISAALTFFMASIGLPAWWLSWPALSFAVVALIYAGIGAKGFSKNRDTIYSPTRALLLPYQALAWVNSRLWTMRCPSEAMVVQGICLGRIPTRTWARHSSAAPKSASFLALAFVRSRGKAQPHRFHSCHACSEIPSYPAAQINPAASSSASSQLPPASVNRKSRLSRLAASSTAVIDSLL
jgi:hypothetical protein